MAILDFWAVLGVHVIAPQAKANSRAGIGVGAPTLAVSLRALAHSGQDTEVNLYCGGLDFSHLLIRRVFMLWTRSKLNRAIAMIALLHRETAEAVAAFAAFEVVPGDVTMMAVAHLVFVSSRFTRRSVFMPFSLEERQCVLAVADRLCRERLR